MNDIEPRETDEAQTERRSSCSGLTLILIIGGVVVAIGASLLLFTQIGSEPGCSGAGPCMLYFYTDD